MNYRLNFIYHSTCLQLNCKGYPFFLGIACFMNGPHGPIDDGGGDHDHLDDDEP